MSDQLY